MRHPFHPPALFTAYAMINWSNDIYKTVPVISSMCMLHRALKHGTCMRFSKSTYFNNMALAESTCELCEFTKGNGVTVNTQWLPHTILDRHFVQTVEQFFKAKESNSIKQSLPRFCSPCWLPPTSLAFQRHTPSRPPCWREGTTRRTATTRGT